MTVHKRPERDRVHRAFTESAPAHYKRTVARVLGTSSSKPAGCRFDETARLRFS
jgi:hypothetical protein